MFKKFLQSVVKSTKYSRFVRKEFSSTSVTFQKEPDEPKCPKNDDQKTEDKKPKEDLILVDRDGPITLIGINRPEHRNAINSAAAKQLCEAIHQFEHDETSTVGVLYGVGGSFCSGYEIGELGGDKLNTDILMEAEGSVGPTRRHLKKTMVCAINGYCVANGLEIALLCDLRVMEESAILGFFNRRIGVPVIDGGTIRLPAMIGISRALDLILTGRQVTAKEAFEYGIANRIVATGTSFGQAVNLAFCISKFPQAALNHDRNAVYSAVYDSRSFETAIQNEILSTSKEVLEAMNDVITKFQSGVFHGAITNSIKEKSMADWEKVEIKLEEKSKNKADNTDKSTKK